MPTFKTFENADQMASEKQSENLHERRVGCSILIRYIADEEVVKATLPSSFQPLSPGEMLVSFQQHEIFGGSAGEFRDPDVYSYTEAVLKIPCHREGVRYLFPVLGWTNSAHLAAGWQLSGIAHHEGQVSLTRFHSADDNYSEPKIGQTLSFKVRGLNEMLLGHFTIQRQLTESEVPIPIGPNLIRRHLIDPISERELLNDIAVNWVTDYKVISAWEGNAHLEVLSQDLGFIAPFQPQAMLPSCLILSNFSAQLPIREVLEDFRKDVR